MAEEKSSAEPVVAEIKIEELKKILTDRFARDVSAAAARRMLRPLTLFGLPGIVLAGTLVWGAISTNIQSTATSAQREIEGRLGQRMDREFEQRAAQAQLQARNDINTAFEGRQGEALTRALQAAVSSPEFQRRLDEIVTLGLQKAWTERNAALRGDFLQQIRNDQEFRRAFAGDVEQAMVGTQSVQRIIAEALARSVTLRPGDDRGHLVALALLAATDQAAANAGVLRLVGNAASREEREVGLNALGAVSFTGNASGGPPPSVLLTAAFDGWRRHCADAACTPDQPAVAAMVGFLRRGGDLRGAEQESWILALRLWHEELVRDAAAPAREASLALVPRALGQIGSPAAVAVLREWVTGGDRALSLTASAAIAGLPAGNMPPEERLQLFRSIWTRVAEGASARAAVGEAAWMALGVVSRGAPSAAGYEVEASLARLLPADLEARRGDLATWASQPAVAVARGREVMRPPRTPCAAATDTAGERGVQLRTDLCALAALLRPANGAAEWQELRPVLVQRDRVVLLGLLWAIAAERGEERSALPAAARLAPLADLLMSAQPTPPAFQLAALLLLRGASDREAWLALERFGPDLADGTPYMAAARWLSRGDEAEERWYAARLASMPAAQRAAVLRGLLGLGAGETEGRDAPLLLDRLQRSPVAAVYAMEFVQRQDPALVLAIAERESLLGRLQSLATRRGTAGGVDHEVPRRLLAALQDAGGWAAAEAALPAATAGPQAPLPLAPAAGRFGRIRLLGGDLLHVPEGAGDVVFQNLASRETRVLRAGEIWHVPARRTGAVEEWLYRLPDAEPRRLAAIEPERLVLAPGREDRVPVIRRDQVYRVEDLPTSGQDMEGWARIEGVTAGERLVVATMQLGADVDTVVALHRGNVVLGEDDDGGNGLDSLLEWTADRPGAVLLQLRNIRAQGPFSLMVTAR